MGKYDLFRKIAQSNLTSKERDVNQMKYDILFDFEDSPSFTTALKNGVSQDFHIVDENAINKNPNKKRVLCKPDESISIGDSIYWKNTYWLCTNIDSDDTVQSKGIIERCNNTLILTKSNIALENRNVPCVIGSTRVSSTGVEDNTYITAPKGTIYVRVPNTSSTSNITRNDIYRLSSVDSYKVMDIDRVSEPGLLILEMCWYEVQQQAPVYILEILNGDSIQVNKNDSLTIHGQVTNTTTSTIISPTPAFLFQSSNQSVLTVNNLGVVTIVGVGTATITCKLSSDVSISDTISVEVVEILTNNYVVELFGESEICLNYSSTITARVLNNGVWDNTKGVNWTVTNQDLSSNQYVAIVSQDFNSVILQASSDIANKNKIIVVKATLTDNILIYGEKSIKLTTLF